MEGEMKSRMLMLFLAAALVGCGKSAEFKKVEADLNQEIQKVHMKQMATMKVLDSLTTSLDVAIAKHTELVAKYPKAVEGHTADDIAAAKAGIADARTAMDNWMKSYKPYDENQPHEQVMGQLNKDMEGLMGMQTRIDAAIKSASDAINAHAKAAEEVMAKAAKKRK
jgi:hypothetical protein